MSQQQRHGLECQPEFPLTHPELLIEMIES